MAKNDSITPVAAFKKTWSPPRPMLAEPSSPAERKTEPKTESKTEPEPRSNPVPAPVKIATVRNYPRLAEGKGPPLRLNS